MRYRIRIAILAAAALASSCVPVPPAQPAAPAGATPAAKPATTVPSQQMPVPADGLAGTSWTLLTLGGQPALPDATATLRFAGGIAAGSDGCNDYSTGHTAGEGKISFQQPVASTKKACPDPAGKQATAFQVMLGLAATYQVTASQLTLSDESATPLATFAAQSTDLGGTAWEAISYNNGKGGVTSILAGTMLTAAFNNDGHLRGSGGCNDYSATYTSDGKSTIQVGPVVSTMKACAQPSGVMEQEQQYLTALGTAATYRMDAARLEFRTVNGAIAASFEAESPAATAPSLTASQIRLDNPGPALLVAGG